MGNDKGKGKEAERQPFSPRFANLIAEFGALSQTERLSFARAAAGIVGAQLTFGGASAPPQTQPAPRQGGGTSGKPPPKRQTPTNALAGTEVKKTYDAIKAKVSKVKRSGGTPTEEDLKALQAAKTEYFRAQSLAKGKEGGSPDQKGPESGQGGGGLGSVAV